MCGDDVDHAVAGLERGAGASGFAQQRVEHVARSVGVGKQLAAGFLVKADAELAEERDGVTRRERAEDAADDRRRPPQKSRVGDARVGDVAARPAADEDFRAGLSGALQQDDRSDGIGAAREDGGGEAGGAGADDDDVSDALCYASCAPSARRWRSAAIS